MDGAKRVCSELQRLTEEGRSKELVTGAAEPLYNALINRCATLFEEIVSAEPLASDLARLRFDERAGLSGYLQLLSDQMWSLFCAFESDPELAATLRTDFPSFVADFCAVTGLDRDMFAATVESASVVLGWSGGTILAAFDGQLFDLLQTITGRGTARATGRASEKFRSQN